jgi:hypothetical protein
VPSTGRDRLRLEDAADLSQTVWMKAIDNNLHRIRDLRAMPGVLEFPASQSEPIVARIASHPWEVAPRSLWPISIEGRRAAPGIY